MTTYDIFIEVESTNGQLLRVRNSFGPDDDDYDSPLGEWFDDHDNTAIGYLESLGQSDQWADAFNAVAEPGIARIKAWRVEEGIQLSLPPQTGTRSYARHGAPNYASRTAAGCEAAGEPVFLLRAQDVCAPEAVRVWAEELESLGDVTQSIPMRVEAESIARAMEDWQWRKVPD